MSWDKLIIKGLNPFVKGMKGEKGRVKRNTPSYISGRFSLITFIMDLPFR